MARRRKKDEWDGNERREPAKVLVVADDDGGRELLVRLLGRAGYRPIGAENQDDGLAAVHDELPRCVVLSLAAGGIGSNLKLLDLIRSSDDRRVSSARAVIIAESPKNRAFSFESGTDAFLVRPYHADELLEIVDDIIRRPDVERARHRRDELVKHGEMHQA